MLMTKDQEEWALYRIFSQRAAHYEAEAKSFRESAEQFSQWKDKPRPPDGPEPVCTCVQSPLKYCDYCGH